MKKIILLFVSVLMLSSFQADPTTDFNIVGKWKADDGKEVGYLIFDEEGYAYIEMNEIKIGGKEFIFQGKKGSMSYEIDYTKSPLEIDLIVTIHEDNITERLLCIAKIIDNDQMLFEISYNGTRPTKFIENDLIFTRVKE